MRLIGRYFAIGATLGSVSGLVMLVLIWTWMTVHLGVFGFLIGWIPAGLAAAAIWLAMVLLWGPILIVGAMVSAALVVLRAHPAHEWSTPDVPAAIDPAERETDSPAPKDPGPEEPRDLGSEPPAEAAPRPAPAPPVAQPPPPAPNTRPPEDLGGDAAAAGDTSRKPQR